MKKIILFAAIVLMAGFSTSAMAEGTASTVTATAAGSRLIVPMTLAEITPLHFGTITLPDALGGSVVLSTAALRTFTGVAASAILPTATNAVYTVKGTYNATYALTLPTDITVKETIGSTATMTINALTVLFTGGVEKTGLSATSKLDASGNDGFIVGGTLTVKPAQIGGIYAGTFSVTVDYN